jgi:integrase
VPLTALQIQMRHADVKTTLRIYSHVIPQSQRGVMKNLGINPIITNIHYLI